MLVDVFNRPELSVTLNGEAASEERASGNFAVGPSFSRLEANSASQLDDAWPQINRADLRNSEVSV